MSRRRASKLRSLRAAEAKYGGLNHRQGVQRLRKKKFGRRAKMFSRVPAGQVPNHMLEDQRRGRNSQQQVVRLRCPECEQLYRQLRPDVVLNCERCGCKFMPALKNRSSTEPTALLVSHKHTEFRPHLGRIMPYVDCPHGCGHRIWDVRSGKIVVCGKCKEEIWVV